MRGLVSRGSSSGGSKGGARDAHPLHRGPDSFNFMQFLGKFGKIVCWRPLLESFRPHLRGILDSSLSRVSRGYGNGGYCSGQYASYWNTVLLESVFNVCFFFVVFSEEWR